MIKYLWSPTTLWQKLCLLSVLPTRSKQAPHVSIASSLYRCHFRTSNLMVISSWKSSNCPIQSWFNAKRQIRNARKVKDLCRFFRYLIFWQHARWKFMYCALVSVCTRDQRNMLNAICVHFILIVQQLIAVR